MSIDYKELPEQNAAEITLNGAVKQAEYEGLFKRFDAYLKDRDDVKVLLVVNDTETLKSMDFKTFWEGLKFDSQHWMKYGKCAMVSDVTWFSPMIQVIDKLTPIKARRFDLNEIDDARTWLYAQIDA